MRLRSTIFSLATLFGAVTSALAGAGSITTTVTPLQPNVTYSTPAQMIYIGYRVAIANTDGNTINHIRFRASAAVTDPAELATFDSAEGANCVTTNAAKTAIECWIGQLQAGASYPEFVVFFKAPVKVVNGVNDGANEDMVTLSGEMVYAEGGNGNNPLPNSVVSWGSAPLVTLGTASDTDVKSGVPKAGGTFFTGVGGISSTGDKFTTLVSVPPSTLFSTAEILESMFTQGCVSFLTCWETKISVQGNVTNTYSPYLTIVMRQDASNIGKGVKIDSVLVNYVDDNDVAYPNIGNCATGPQPNGLGIPCIVSRTHYKNRNVPGWTPALDGDFEWVLISLKNGRFGIQ